jgi:nucleotide-binding universal stress UspA family protein
MEKLREKAMKRAQEAVMIGEKFIIEGHLLASGTVGDPSAVPKQLILKEASDWGAHLIVLGSHGRRGLDRLLLGSVSEAIAAHAPCSVEVIRCSVKVKAVRLV